MQSYHPEIRSRAVLSLVSLFVCLQSGLLKGHGMGVITCKRFFKKSPKKTYISANEDDRINIFFWTEVHSSWITVAVQYEDSV